MNTCRTVSVPYYKGHMELHVPQEVLAGVLTSPFADSQGVPNPSELVRQALRSPIGSAPLAELARGKKNILVVTSDHTRPVPSHITLPILTEELLQASPEAEITVLIATGLHRATTPEEQAVKFGSAMLEKFRFVVHDAFDQEQMRFVKILPSGARFEVNRLALETDMLVTEGFIEPHFFAGFSGGRKSILPGISSAVSVSENHSARAIAHPLARGGMLKGNPIHEDMVDAARAVNVAFTLNVALNSRKEIIGAFAGELEAAHEAGCAFVSRMCSVPPIKGDIVVTSNGGYPLDQNLYQCPKSISTAADCANDGAVIIIAASCVDGYGGEHFRELITRGTPQEIQDYLLAIPPDKTIPEQWCAQIYARIMLSHEIIVVSDHLTAEQAERANMRHADTLNEALAMAQDIKGRDAQVVVIPDGMSVIISQ